MTDKELIVKIKSRGFWKVKYRPTIFDNELLPDRNVLRDQIQKSVVEIRGWDYPHLGHWVNPKQHSTITGTDFVEGGSDWNAQIEFWRMYQSGQFLHLLAVNEDWFDQDDWLSSRPDLQAIKPGTVLDPVGALYRIIEIFEFLHRLAKNGIYTDDVYVSISLENTNGRILKMLDHDGRAPLFFEYKVHQASIEYKKKFSVTTILNSHREAAINAAVWIFESFNWNNPPRAVFENDLQKFYDKKF